MNLKLATIFGIPLYLNVYTILMAIFILFINGEPGLVWFGLGLFFVVLHEYGHCFMARRYGWNVIDVYILPIGGVANVIFKHDNPLEEMYVALAGPAVNFIIILISIPLLYLADYLGNNILLTVFTMSILINLMIMLFNLLPCIPLDGGRVLRAFLSSKIGHKNSTWWAARIGQFGGLVLTIVFMFWGFGLAAIIMLLMGVMAQYELNLANKTVDDPK